MYLILGDKNPYSNVSIQLYKCVLWRWKLIGLPLVYAQDYTEEVNTEVDWSEIFDLLSSKSNSTTCGECLFRGITMSLSKILIKLNKMSNKKGSWTATSSPFHALFRGSINRWTNLRGHWSSSLFFHWFLNKNALLTTEKYNEIKGNFLSDNLSNHPESRN